MYYRSCEWGNNDSTFKVYQNARILHEISTYNKTAICIGCITYAAYRTAKDVANDVWLACANGVDSVRIFLGDSWVYSAVNESAGIQSLHSMLDLCRAGGTAITEYHAKWDNDLFITILGSVFGDL
ncbi:MAG TPA: hypothetical protein VKM55_08980 [Candidatus Lokiarchaeia archaeon]|nr:hypothetical protein [Candidatus Lokiarchaeia archaeon]